MGILGINGTIGVLKYLLNILITSKITQISILAAIINQTHILNNDLYYKLNCIYSHQLQLIYLQKTSNQAASRLNMEPTNIK